MWLSNGSTCWGKNLKNTIKKTLNKHPFMFVLVVSLFLLLVPFFILTLMRQADKLEQINYFRLEDGVNIWFAFWGSYIGAMATVLVGVGTIYLSMKVDEISRSQSGLQIASGFHKLEIHECRLYDCYSKKIKVPLEILEKFETRKRYILEIRARESFPPYFDIDLQEFEWLKKDKLSKESLSFLLEKEEMEVVIENNEHLLFFIMFDKKESDINYFYHIHFYEPKGMFPYEKQRIMCLRLNFKNKMRIYDKPDHPADDIKIDLRLQVENGYLSSDAKVPNINMEKTKTSFGVPLVIHNRKIVYVENHQENERRRDQT